MPRRARPWFRTARSEWFVTHMGKQTPLGVFDPADEAGALAAFAKLVASHMPENTKLRNSVFSDPTTVAEAVERFRAAGLRRLRRGEVKQKTLDDYEYALRPFVAAFGPRPLSELLAGEGLELVKDWGANPAWSLSTRNDYLGVILGVFKLAGLRLPVKRPPKQSRGAATVVSDDGFEAALGAAVKGKYAGDLRQLLRVLRETGARPEEISRLSVSAVDWTNACTRSDVHKTARHGGARVIHFTAAAMAVLAEQRAAHGSGLLFRTRYGNQYGAKCIVRRCGVISKRVGFRFIAYGAGRHSFCTHALINGVPEPLVAALMGHAGTAMMSRHYSHVGSNARALKDAAERARKVG